MATDDNIILNLTELSDEPLQAQIARQLRAYILADELRADSSLPSIRSMARQQRVSVITVQRAYEALMREGLIHSRRGKGYFVSMIEDQDRLNLAIQRLKEGITPPLQAAAAEGLKEEEVMGVIKEVIRKEFRND